jgi:hypothetical protein
MIESFSFMNISQEIQNQSISEMSYHVDMNAHYSAEEVYSVPLPRRLKTKIWRITVLPRVLYGSETPSLTLTQVSKTQASENKYALQNVWITKQHDSSGDCSDGIETGYGLDGQGTGVRVTVGALHSLQAGSEDHSAFYPMGIGVI